MSAIRQKFGRSLMQQSSLNTARTAGLSPAAAQQSKITVTSICLRHLDRPWIDQQLAEAPGSDSQGSRCKGFLELISFNPRLL